MDIVYIYNFIYLSFSGIFKENLVVDIYLSSQVAAVEVCQHLQADMDRSSDGAMDSGSEDEQPATDISASLSQMSSVGAEMLFRGSGIPARPVKRKKQKQSQPPPAPIVSQLVEMGFPRKSVELAEKALGT